MKVNEIITHDPEVIRPETALIEAAQKMRSLDIGMLPVCDGDRLVGVITRPGHYGAGRGARLRSQNRARPGGHDTRGHLLFRR